MSEDPGRQSWWQTLPGILTALGGVITAIAGLTSVISQTGLFGHKENPPSAESRPLPRLAAVPALQPAPPLASKNPDFPQDKPKCLRLGPDPGTSDTANGVKDWRAVPTQEELDKLVANPRNDPRFPYSDYRPDAPDANLDLPGAAILAAMNCSADNFGSRRPVQPIHADLGYKNMSSCLMTGFSPTNWSDLAIHYYCQMSKPRACYTYALSGNSTGGEKYSRPAAYQGCATGKLPQSDDFAFVTETQPRIFQYVMFGQTHAFNHSQEQAIINAFYGVTNPTDPKECLLKRPRRTEDPTDGTHCLVNKTMEIDLVGKGG